ncbi:transposase IS3/IS911 family protein [Halomonas sp. HAL1]|nr:transposase IS3/IS911 family protein [Halomonas sp. HAL1]
MNVGHSSMDKWVRQFRQERDGLSPKATPMTPGQFKIREFEKRIRDIEREKDILKNRYGLAPACRYRTPTAAYTQPGHEGCSRWLFGGRPR